MLFYKNKLYPLPECDPLWSEEEVYQYGYLCLYLAEMNIPSSYARCLIFKKQFPKLLYSPEIESRLELLDQLIFKNKT
jgi:hypothetical protein